MSSAGASVRRIEDASQLLWDGKASPGAISNLNKNAYENIEKWRNRPLSELRYPYAFVDGIFSSAAGAVRLKIVRFSLPQA